MAKFWIVNAHDVARAASKEDRMKLLIICTLGAAVFAAPCVYDVASREPSPLAGLVAATSGPYAFQPETQLPPHSSLPSQQPLS